MAFSGSNDACKANIQWEQEVILSLFFGNVPLNLIYY